ncbi:MAG: endonuclease/exonuclease/phosphatase family protein [Planctomycetota bacterium]
MPTLLSASPTITLAAALTALAAAAPHASGQFDPLGGQWGKEAPTDVRVMTWNIEDGICRTANKANDDNNWAALARIVAALEPDILILQEAGDNSGNGTGSSGDSAAQLETTLGLFLSGGTDPFRGGPVTEYVQLYRPGYDLPNIFVSGSTDGFNRNVVLSRWPFADLNGDGTAETSAFSTVNGSSGIRGIQLAEINLPSDVYVGNLVIGNAHLKSGGSSSDRADREQAATALATYLWNLYEGAGTGSVDPNNQVNDFPMAQNVLPPHTAVIWGGDFNEDELTNGRKGPVDISTQNAVAGGTSDGTDKDGTDAQSDLAVEPFGGSRRTLGGSKLDWLMWQDSAVTARNQFIFNSQQVDDAAMPPELIGFGIFPPLNGRTATSVAADHRPVIVDFILPLGESDDLPGEFALLAPADGQQGLSVPLVSLDWADADNADSYEVTVATDPALTQVVFSQSNLPASQAFFIGAERCTTYFWSVAATNFAGTRDATPAVAAFSTINPAEQNDDGTLDAGDFFAWVANFGNADPRADVNGDGAVEPGDFFAWVAAFGGSC